MGTSCRDDDEKSAYHHDRRRHGQKDASDQYPGGQEEAQRCHIQALFLLNDSATHLHLLMADCMALRWQSPALKTKWSSTKLLGDGHLATCDHAEASWVQVMAMQSQRPHPPAQSPVHPVTDEKAHKDRFT